MTKILYDDDNLTINRYVANLLLALAAVMLCAHAFNEIGIYHVDKPMMRISTCATIICISIIQIIGRVRIFAAHRITKYLIMILISIATLVTMSLLNISVTIILVIPSVVAVNYHSKKLAVWTMIFTIVCAVFAPLIGLLLKTWDISYFMFMINCINPGVLTKEQLATYGVSSVTSNYFAILEMISLPQVGYALFLGCFIITTSWRKRKKYKQQIDKLSESRNKILMGMSDIVESRDNSTGGHIRRTSSVVKYLMDALINDKTYDKALDESYCDNIIKAAPMHDLGKIAIADSILNKPGRLTTDEFTVIKEHPRKSHAIIKKVLDGLNDEKLTNVAENIALYHHERYDGTGYPLGLKGDEIPLEAKIMAIADVYDALVSERCYKKPISQEDAYKIIKDEMGTHFDPKLWNCFDMAYPSLVKYYS